MFSLYLSLSLSLSLSIYAHLPCLPLSLLPLFPSPSTEPRQQSPLLQTLANSWGSHWHTWRKASPTAWVYYNSMYVSILWHVQGCQTGSMVPKTQPLKFAAPSINTGAVPGKFLCIITLHPFTRYEQYMHEFSCSHKPCVNLSTSCATGAKFWCQGTAFQKQVQWNFTAPNATIGSTLTKFYVVCSEHRTWLVCKLRVRVMPTFFRANPLPFWHSLTCGSFSCPVL